jgi:hemoglobin
MMATHAGMGISTNDFNDLVNHLAMALTQAQVAQADIMSIATVLTSTAVTMAIVEDPNNNASVYQRVGRKPAIQTVVQDFAGRVFMDATINGFFDTSTTAVARLGTCLTSQICSVQGPCKYGQEVVPEVGGTPCRDMMSTHRNITSPRGGGVGSRNIGRADFDALVGHLVAALTAARVPPADRMQYLNALGPMCRDIVSDPMTCP